MVRGGASGVERLRRAARRTSAAVAAGSANPGAGPAVATPAPPPPGARTATDQCGASDLRYLVGRPKSEIPVPVDPGNRRVLCAGCPMTEDYSPMRQTILYAADTGLVTSVACG